MSMHFVRPFLNEQLFSEKKKTQYNYSLLKKH